MSGDFGASNAFFQMLPPRTGTNRNGMQSASTSTSAASAAVFTGLSASVRPTKKCMVYFEAVTQDAYVRFRADSGSAGTTASNGILIKAGLPGQTFWLDPSIDVYVDHLAAGSGTLKWYVSS